MPEPDYDDGPDRCEVCHAIIGEDGFCGCGEDHDHEPEDI